MRCSEFVEGTSNKVWSVSVDGKALPVVFGRVGSAGQDKTMTFASAAVSSQHDGPF